LLLSGCDAAAGALAHARGFLTGMLGSKAPARPAQVLEERQQDGQQEGRPSDEGPHASSVDAALWSNPGRGSACQLLEQDAAADGGPAQQLARLPPPLTLEVTPMQLPPVTLQGIIAARRKAAADAATGAAAPEPPQLLETPRAGTLQRQDSEAYGKVGRALAEARWLAGQDLPPGPCQVL
jgi:hypothetical protein